jgi:hypothetical protein
MTGRWWLMRPWTRAKSEDGPWLWPRREFGSRDRRRWSWTTVAVVAVFSMVTVVSINAKSQRTTGEEGRGECLCPSDRRRRDRGRSKKFRPVVRCWMHKPTRATSRLTSYGLRKRLEDKEDCEQDLMSKRTCVDALHDVDNKKKKKTSAVCENWTCTKHGGM